MKKIKGGFILPSAAYTVPRNRIRQYGMVNKKPEVGDLIYGRIDYIGQHSSLENKEGRIHAINDGTRAVFVLGNRYAPDYYEGLLPEGLSSHLDLLARSGLAGVVQCKSSMIKDPSRIAVEGYVCDATGEVINTRQFNTIKPKGKEKPPEPFKTNPVYRYFYEQWQKYRGSGMLLGAFHDGTQGAWYKNHRHGQFKRYSSDGRQRRIACGGFHLFRLSVHIFTERDRAVEYF